MSYMGKCRTKSGGLIRYFEMIAHRFPPPWSVKETGSQAIDSKIISMDDRPHAADNFLDQAEQELLISTVSDEALEKAACGTSWAQTYPQTCVATICIGEPSFPKKLSGQTSNAR
jgi:hypothetical protein